MPRPTSRTVDTAGLAAPSQSCQKTPRPGSWNAGGIVRRWRNVSRAAERRESRRRKPVTLEDVTGNIANCRDCGTRGAQPIMSEDATSGQLERRGNRQKVAKRLWGRREERDQTA